MIQQHALKSFLYIVLQGENNYDRSTKNEVQNNMEDVIIII